MFNTVQKAVGRANTADLQLSCFNSLSPPRSPHTSVAVSLHLLLDCSLTPSQQAAEARVEHITSPHQVRVGQGVHLSGTALTSEAEFRPQHGKWEERGWGNQQPDIQQNVKLSGRGRQKKDSIDRMKTEYIPKKPNQTKEKGDERKEKGVRGLWQGLLKLQIRAREMALWINALAVQA